jgi:hypothetical protein
VFIQLCPQSAIQTDTDSDVIAIHEADEAVQSVSVMMQANAKVGVTIDNREFGARQFGGFRFQLRLRPKFRQRLVGRRGVTDWVAGGRLSGAGETEPHGQS